MAEGKELGWRWVRKIKIRMGRLVMLNLDGEDDLDDHQKVDGKHGDKE